jgi:tetratricopeptide (TPR) repeat protein
MTALVSQRTIVSHPIEQGVGIMLGRRRSNDAAEPSRMAKETGIARWCLQLTLGALFAAAPALHAYGQGGLGSPTSGPFDERASRLRTTVARVEELEAQAWRQTDFDRAASLMGQAADLARSAVGEKHWLTRHRRESAKGLKSVAGLSSTRRQLYADSLKNSSAAQALLSRGDRDRGLSQLRQAHQQRVSALGREHVLLLYGLYNLTLTECEIGDFRAGKEHAEQAVAVAIKAWDEENPWIAQGAYHLATAEYGLKEFEAAEEHLAETIHSLKPVAREGIADFYTTMYAHAEQQMARLLNDQERHAEALPHAQSALEVLSLRLREEYKAVIEAQIEIARSKSGQGDTAAAEIVFKSLMNAVDDTWPPATTARVLTAYAEHLRSLEMDSEAERVETRVRERQRASKVESR